MQQVVKKLDAIVREYSVKFLNLSEEELSFKPVLGKWSKKEIIGHLIDSAQTNIRRFIVAQYQANPEIVYEQNYWVTAQNYQHYNTIDLINLWQLLNKHIVMILLQMHAEKYQLKCKAGGIELVTLEFIAKDYVEHHLHHLKQIVA